MCNKWDPILIIGVSEAFLSPWRSSSASQLHGWRNRLTDGAELLSRVSDLNGGFVRYRTIFSSLSNWRRKLVWRREDKPLSKKLSVQSSEERGSPEILVVICQCLLPISPFTWSIPFSVPQLLKLFPSFFASLASLTRALEWREMHRDGASS